MPKLPETDGRRGRRIPRREWMIGSLVGTMGLATSGWSSPPTDSTASDLAPILAKAKAAGLRDVDSSESKERHFVGIGDAPAGYRDQALVICESLAKVFRDYFETKGFQVDYPDHRLVIVTLKDKESYEKFTGEPAGGSLGGHYDVDANRLVVFDFRGNDDELAAAPERVNTFTLVHEALHQLTYNMGLLERKGDVPVVISEGLATFGEVWQHTNRRSTLGVTNSRRLLAFTQADAQATWFPVEQILTDDDLFTGEATSQVAYAESWVLVHYFLRTPAKLPKFRAYLEALRARRDPTHRLEDARAHLGDLGRLDKELIKHRGRQIGG